MEHCYITFDVCQTKVYWYYSIDTKRTLENNMFENPQLLFLVDFLN